MVVVMTIATLVGVLLLQRWQGERRRRNQPMRAGQLGAGRHELEMSTRMSKLVARSVWSALRSLCATSRISGFRRGVRRKPSMPTREEAMSERPEAQLRTVVRFSGHAVERFRERVRPGLTLEAARDDLIRVVESGRLVSQPPRWIQWDERSPSSLSLAMSSSLSGRRAARPTGRLPPVSCVGASAWRRGEGGAGLAACVDGKVRRYPIPYSGPRREADRLEHGGWLRLRRGEARDGMEVFGGVSTLTSPCCRRPSRLLGLASGGRAW